MEFLSQEEDFKLFENGKQVLYFYANWMNFNKKMITMLNKMEEKYKNIYFLSINVDNFKSLCKRFNVESIPEIIIFSNGIEIKRINGLILTNALNSAFLDIYNK